MDLLGLGSYGSDSEKEEEHEEVHPGIKASIPISAAPDSPPCDAPRTFSAAPAEPESLQAETVHKTQERVELQPAERSFVKEGPPEVGPTRAQAGPSFPESEVPAPTKQGVWSSLPAPKAKRVVQLNLPINKAMLKAAAKEDEEDAAAAKRRKPDPAKSKLTDLLPAPRNGYAPIGGSRLSLGSGEGGAIDLAGPSPSAQPHKGRKAHGMKADSDDEDPMARYGPMPEAGNFMAGPIQDDEQAAGPSAAPGAGVGAWPDQQQYGYEGACDHSLYGAAQAGPTPEQYEAGAYFVGGQPGYEGSVDPAAMGVQGYASAAYPPQLAPHAHDDPGQALFAQALMEEQERAAKRGKGMDLSSIQFKEVNQKDLTYVDPAAKEAANNVRSALGPEYAAKLRSEAKPFEGDRLSKRKHQIGTLFYNAKMKELEIMEGKANSMSQKSHTAAKYGW